MPGDKKLIISFWSRMTCPYLKAKEKRPNKHQIENGTVSYLLLAFAPILVFCYIHGTSDFVPWFSFVCRCYPGGQWHRHRHGVLGQGTQTRHPFTRRNRTKNCIRVKLINEKDGCTAIKEAKGRALNSAIKILIYHFQLI